jgi:hypothetical protein
LKYLRQIRTGYKKRTNLSLPKKVEAKVAAFDILNIKLLFSDDSLASFNEDVAEELKKKNILHHLANTLSLYLRADYT